MLEIRNDLLADAFRRGGDGAMDLAPVLAEALARGAAPERERGWPDARLDPRLCPHRRARELPRRPVRDVSPVRDDGRADLVVGLEGHALAGELDAGDGAVHHGRLLHARRALFAAARLQRADGPALSPLVDRRPAPGSMRSRSSRCCSTSACCSTAPSKPPPIRCNIPSAAPPPGGPISRRSRSIMCVGIFLMLLQAMAFFFRDVAKLRGEEI